MNILVTGALGFLGGRVSVALVREGHNVLMGTRREVGRDIFNADNANYVKIDWANTSGLDDLCAGVEVIVHATGMNSTDCFQDPAGALEVNAYTTARILQSAIRMKVRRFIFISTIHVYTDRLQGTISEESCPSNLHPYATSNRAAEDLVLWAQRSQQIDGIVIRLSNGFGVPAGNQTSCWTLLVNDLCRQAVEMNRMVLKSNGLQSRNFISMQEICQIIIFFINNISLQENVGRVGPINAGGRASYTVREMAELVQTRCQFVLGYTPTLVSMPCLNSDKPVHLDFVLDRLISLGYLHRHNLTDEVDNLLRHCKEFFASKES